MGNEREAEKKYKKEDQRKIRRTVKYKNPKDIN